MAADVLGSLRDEHAAVGQVLDALEQQLGRITDGQAPQAAVISDIVGFCQSYPARLHHKKEDLLVHKLRARDAAAAAAAGDLESEHERLVALTARFVRAAQRLGEPVAAAAQDTFAELARTFVNSYRTHIDTEERFLFPAALWSLTAQDWRELEAQIAALDNAAESPGPDQD